MNHEIYSAALPILELVNSDSRLRAQTSDYGDWYGNLLEHVCDFESEHLEMFTLLRSLTTQISDRSSSAYAITIVWMKVYLLFMLFREDSFNS